MEQGHTLEAVEAFTAAIELVPDATCFFYRGLCYYTINEFDKALADQRPQTLTKESSEHLLRPYPRVEKKEYNLSYASRYLDDGPYSVITMYSRQQGMLDLRFIPVFKERFDMVIPEEHRYSPQVRSLLSFFEQRTLLRYVDDFPVTILLRADVC